MKNRFDLYTKIVLTVIAVCLVAIVLTNLNIMPKSYANESKTKENYTLVPVNPDGSINVKVKDELNVNIEDVGDHSVTGGTIDVSCDNCK